MYKFLDLIFGYKKIKLFYYLNGIGSEFKFRFASIFYKNYSYPKINLEKHQDHVNARVNYYNDLKENTPLGDSSRKISDISRKEDSSVYYFDTVKYLLYFNPNAKINTLFGDIDYTPNIPSITKSRPIINNTNSVLLKLNRIRHFNFIKDYRKFSSKKNKLIGRGFVADSKHLRINFLEKNFNNPLCNVGQINDFRDNEWKLDFVSIFEQLRYKFILCWEGNDVSTSLKYVMSSNSLAVSTKPKYETWFMEGTLIGGVHYVEIKDDFSDLDEKINYYSTHIEEAEKIIKNANDYTKQFKNKKREDLISILVLEKYFKNTNQ